LLDPRDWSFQMLPFSALFGLAFLGCIASPDDTGEPYAPTIDPADFSTTIDNPYFPLPPGTTYVSLENGEDVVHTVVTSDTTVVMGVTCVVVHDTLVAKDDTLLEDTYDWYAQDSTGNVWYFGEDTASYEGGTPDTEGSWTGGVGGAYPGILMEADPQVGDSYRQEYLPGVAEDSAEVVSVTAKVDVAYGSFSNCVETNETSALEPDLVEQKDYATGLGEIRAEDVKGGEDQSELTDVLTK
jgi:hypothetical protein